MPKTIPLHNAIPLGVHMLEFDIMMTANDQFVIQHDPTVAATFCKCRSCQ